MSRNCTTLRFVFVVIDNLHSLKIFIISFLTHSICGPERFHKILRPSSLYNPTLFWFSNTDFILWLYFIIFICQLLNKIFADSDNLEIGQLIGIWQQCQLTHINQVSTSSKSHHPSYKQDAAKYNKQHSLKWWYNDSECCSDDKGPRLHLET